MKKKETWREKKPNARKVKLLSTIISICLAIAVMGVGVFAATQRYTATVTNAVDMHFANLNGTVSVEAYADKIDNNSGIGMANRPELEYTDLYTNDDGALYTSISSGVTVAGGNLQFEGADFFTNETVSASGLTGDTTKAVIGYIFKYVPVEGLTTGIAYNQVTITENSGSALNVGPTGTSVETRYYITTDDVDAKGVEDVITAIVPNEGASYDIESTQSFYVLAFCTYTNPSGLSIKVDGTWEFELDIQSKLAELETTSLENELNMVDLQVDNPTIALLQNVTSVNKAVEEIAPNNANYMTYRPNVLVTKTGTKPLTTYAITTTLTNVTANANNPTRIAEGGTATLTFTADEGYNLPDNVTVTGATGNWNKSTGTLTISNPEGVVSVSVVGPVKAISSITIKPSTYCNFNDAYFTYYLNGDTNGVLVEDYYSEFVLKDITSLIIISGDNAMMYDLTIDGVDCVAYLGEELLPFLSDGSVLYVGFDI